MKPTPPQLGIRDLIAAPDLRENVDLQLQAVEAVFRMRRDEQNAVLGLLGERIGVGLERLRSLEAMESRMDRRYALRMTGRRDALARAPDEEIYPHKGWIGEYLRWSDHTSAPTAWNFWCGISLLGAAARRNVYCFAGARPIWLNNYVLFVGPSGTGKSSAIANARAVALAANGLLETQGRERQPPEDLRLAFAPDSGTPEEWLSQLSSRRYQVEFVGADGDPQGDVSPVFRPDCSCYIVKDELVALIGRESFGAPRWWNYLLDLYDAPEKWSDAKLSAKRNLNRVAISALLGCARDLLIEQVSSVVFTGGLTARMVLSYREHGKSHVTSTTTDPVIRDCLAEQIAAISALPFETEVALSRSGHRYYRGWIRRNEEMRRRAHRRVEGWYSRANFHLLKTAACLSLSRGDLEITAEDLHVAWVALRQEIPGLEYLMTYVPGLSPVGKLEDVWGAIKSHGPLSWGEMVKKCQAIAGGRVQLQEIVDTLIAQRRAQWDEVLIEGEDGKRRLERALVMSEDSGK